MSKVIRCSPAVATGMAVFVLWLAGSSAAAAQSAVPFRDAHRLGGATAFYQPGLTSAASLVRMSASPGLSDDIRVVLRDAGASETADAVLSALSGASTIAAVGSCDGAAPADGVIVSCDFQKGSTLQWMAFRPEARRKNRAPSRLERVRWAGDKPFRAYLFRVTRDSRIYTFVIPMACANLSLMSMTETPGQAVDVTVERVCDPATGAVRGTFTAGGKDLDRVQRMSVGHDGTAVGELTGPSWTYVATRPGTYTFDAVDRRGGSYPVVRREIPLMACPLPAPEPAPAIIAPTCGVSLSVIRSRGAYQLTVDATRSTTGSATVAPLVTVALRDDADHAVGETLTLDQSLTTTVTVRRAGEYRATATVTTPAPPLNGAPRYEGTAVCEASVTAEAPPGGAALFLEALGGKDRRVRPDDQTSVEFAQCSPLAGVKLGVGRRFGNNWELAGAVGGAISLVTADDKVKESALFVDAEIDKYLSNGMFFGGGLSLWDVTRSDTWTTAGLLHLGMPLTRQAVRYPVHLVAEGRLFFNRADDIASNYLVWGGVRVRFGRQ